jgi:Flp pilus assembly protein TadG
MVRRRQADKTRGQTLVEFALILPIFVLVLVGIFDLGRGVYVYNTLNNAAREAVRVAIVNQNCTAIGNEADSGAVSVGIDWNAGLGCNAAANDVKIRFLQPDYTATAPCTATPRLGCIVEVTVQYEFTAATPIVGNIIGVLNLEGSARQPIERTRNAAP